jgi:hypothetical protein
MFTLFPFSTFEMLRKGLSSPFINIEELKLGVEEERNPWAGFCRTSFGTEVLTNQDPKSRYQTSQHGPFKRHVDLTP